MLGVILEEPYKSSTLLQNLRRRSSAIFTCEVDITVEHSIQHAFTNNFQHCKCLSGSMSFKAKDEKTTAQFLNWSAVKPLKSDAIFDGICPILEGTFNLLILFWSTLKSCSSSKFNSFQILSIFFVVPRIKLCMGSMTTHAMKSKYGRWIKDENRTPFTLSFFSRPFFEVTELWTLQTCSLWSMLVRKSQLSQSNPEKSCFSPNDDLGNSFLHLLQPFSCWKAQKTTKFARCWNVKGNTKNSKLTKSGSCQGAVQPNTIPKV